MTVPARHGAADAFAGRLVRVSLAGDDDEEGWREAVRGLLAADVPPDRVSFALPGGADLFGGDTPYDLPPAGDGPPPKVPRAAAELTNLAIDHSDPQRFDLLYRFLYRARREPGLADNPVDADTEVVRRMVKSVRRDLHKMHAFVRFRLIPGSGPKERYMAWFEPDHHIVETTAPFFIRRFTNMDWTIVTPRKSIAWQNGHLTIGPGGQRSDVPEDDAFEDAWRAYFASIFNPARVKVKAMQAEMPKKYWRNLPEAQLIPSLIEGAAGRTASMAASAKAKDDELFALPDAEPHVPVSLPRIADALKTCTRCPLYEDATQAVPGIGPADAKLYVIGEQPGDQEDLTGTPFVGPAGQLLREALGDVGIEEDEIYITNAVKHFKFTMRGKRRIHQTPKAGEIDVCADFARAEHRAIGPAVTLTLGATALRAMLGRATTLKSVRGENIAFAGGTLVPTVHPSFLLRLRDDQGRKIETEKFRRDLDRARELAAA